jgi:hypothetical protein
MVVGGMRRLGARHVAGGELTVEIARRAVSTTWASACRVQAFVQTCRGGPPPLSLAQGTDGRRVRAVLIGDLVERWSREQSARVELDHCYLLPPERVFFF